MRAGGNRGCQQEAIRTPCRGRLTIQADRPPFIAGFEQADPAAGFRGELDLDQIRRRTPPRKRSGRRGSLGDSLTSGLRQREKQLLVQTEAGVAKLDYRTGALRWGRVFGSCLVDQTWNVAVDGSGGVAMAGMFVSDLKYQGDLVLESMKEV